MGFGDCQFFANAIIRSSQTKCSWSDDHIDEKLGHQALLYLCYPNLKMRTPRGVVANRLHCKMVVSELELLSLTE